MGSPSEWSMASPLPGPRGSLALADSRLEGAMPIGSSRAMVATSSVASGFTPRFAECSCPRAAGVAPAFVGTPPVAGDFEAVGACARPIAVRGIR